MALDIQKHQVDNPTGSWVIEVCVWKELIQIVWHECLPYLARVYLCLEEANHQIYMFCILQLFIACNPQATPLAKTLQQCLHASGRKWPKNLTHAHAPWHSGGRWDVCCEFFVADDRNQVWYCENMWELYIIWWGRGFSLDSRSDMII